MPDSGVRPSVDNALTAIHSPSEVQDAFFCKRVRVMNIEQVEISRFKTWYI